MFEVEASVAIPVTDGVGIVFVTDDGTAERVDDDEVGADEFCKPDDCFAAFWQVEAG